MSVKTKKRVKNLGKICGALLFTLLMFSNIKVAMMDDAEILKGDISLFGVEMNLFDVVYAKAPCFQGCWWDTSYQTCTLIGDDVWCYSACATYNSIYCTYTYN